MFFRHLREDDACPPLGGGLRRRSVVTVIASAAFADVAAT
jgi:hypothetical protein